MSPDIHYCELAMTTANASSSNLQEPSSAHCENCQMPVSEQEWFARMYEAHRRVAFCSPRCVLQFLEKGRRCGSGADAGETDQTMPEQKERYAYVFINQS
jgi:predicted sulfurtransferase